jgi:ABC-type branched-subunit amino acid transport system ATPase component
MTSIWGGMIGGGVLRTLPEFLRFVADYQEMVYGALVVGIMLASRDGIVGLLKRMTRTIRLKPSIAGSGDTAEAPRTERISAMLAGARKVESLAPALQIAGVSKSFGALAAVKDVSLTVPAGIIYGVIGPNGAGKTTLFNLVSGFIAPSSGGTIALFGEPLKPLAVRERIAMGVTRTFQNVAIYGKLSCLDNVILGLGQNAVSASLWKSVEDALGTMPARERARRALESLEAVGLGKVAHQPAGSLSLGNQRRLEIARALVSRPKLLMLDEPVSGLDVDEQERIGELLRAINATLGTTMLVIEHNIRFVVGLSRTLSVMHLGSILVEGDPHKVIKLPEVSRVYFGETERAA